MPSIAPSASPQLAQAVALSPAETTAMDDMQQQPQNAAILEHADQVMMQKCLATRGVTVYPSTYIYDPDLSYALQTATPEAYAWFYQHGNYPNMAAVSPSPEMAKAVGYGAAAPVDPAMAAMDVAYAKLSRNNQLTVQKQIDGQDLDGNQVSDLATSCRGQVFTTLYGGLQLNFGLDKAQTATVDTIIGGVGGTQALAAIAADPAMEKANASWAGCMTKVGVTGATTAPAVALAPPATLARGTKTATAADINTASTLATKDAACAQSAGIEPAYHAAAYAYLAQHIKGNAAVFAKYFTVHDAQVATAKKYLGIK